MEKYIIGLLVFLVSAFVLTKLIGRSSGAKKRSLENISRQFYENSGEESVLLAEEKIDSAGEAFLNVPFFGGMYRKLKLSGIRTPFLVFMLIYIGAIVLLGIMLGNFFNKMYPVGFGLAFIIILVIANMVLGSRIAKREQYYLNAFPDAVDMIVRSVKSGQPLMSALKMIAASTSQPLAGDVQRVIDEVSYGRPLPEALKKMADRVGFMDMSFFVVILSVQQETGGNLAEVLTNLANIIRKRKQLKLKVKALTAQSKMTTMIFSCIPFIQMAAVYAIKPDYLKVYTTTNSGVYALMFALGCIGMAVFLGRRVSNLEV